MTLATAIARINTWLPSGFVKNFGSSLNVLPMEADLPGLALFPGADFGTSAESVVVAGGSFEVAFLMEHWILGFGSGQKLGSERVDALVTLVDAYFAKLITDATLNATLTRPIEGLSVVLGARLLGGLSYECAVVSQRWKVKY